MQQSQIISISNLASGIYFVKITLLNNEVIFQKLVKE